VSSSSVLDTPGFIQANQVSESDILSLDQGKLLSTGYAQTKWVSEALCREAQQRGLPVAICRPGYIVGNGPTQSDDFLWRLLKGSIAIGMAPMMRNRLNACSCDYVSSIIVAAIKESKFQVVFCCVFFEKKDNNSFVTAQVFHTVNPDNFSFDDLFAVAGHYGFDVKPVDYIQWRDTLQGVFGGFFSFCSFWFLSFFLSFLSFFLFSFLSFLFFPLFSLFSFLSVFLPFFSFLSFLVVLFFLSFSHSPSFQPTLLQLLLPSFFLCCILCSTICRRNLVRQSWTMPTLEILHLSSTVCRCE
jgi:hypothetical protein